MNPPKPPGNLPSNNHLVNRRSFVKGAAAATALTACSASLFGQTGKPELKSIRDEVRKRHEEALRRLQDWIRQTSIAAENRGFPEGADYTIQLLKEAGFDEATRAATDGLPGVFARLNVGAPRTVGIYFMYDVKQVDPSEWSSPPFEPTLVKKSGIGTVLVGRGAVNQKGPQAAVLAAIHAIRGAGRKLPVNIVLVAEGEEEIGSPNFRQIVHRPEVRKAFADCIGVFMPSAVQSPDGVTTISLGAKGIVELELTASGERWGRGPRKDIHSSNKARVDSPAWHLIHALTTLVTKEGNEPAIEAFADKARPITAAEKKMIAEAAQRMSEEQSKKLLGVDRWIDDASWIESLERLVSRPTVNIEGLTGGYTGPGGKTILPHIATAKLDLRLVPEMSATEALAALKSHLTKRGYGDIEVRMTGGYDPTSTPADSKLILAQLAVYERFGLQPLLWPRGAGSWPGCVFTGEPLRLPAGHFGLGHGGGHTRPTNST